MNQYEYPARPEQGTPPQNQTYVGTGPAGTVSGWQGQACRPAPSQSVWNAGQPVSQTEQPVYQAVGQPAPGQYPPAGGPAVENGWGSGYSVPPFTGYGQPCPPQAAYAPAGYPQAAVPQPAYVPSWYSQQAYGYAPPFALRPGRDPRLTGAAKTMNRLCLVVLLQTLAAVVFEIPLVGIMTTLGVNIVSDGMAYQWLSAVMVPLSTALPFFLYLKIGQKDAAAYLRFEKAGFGTALLCVLAGLAICLLGNFPSAAVQNFFGNFGYEPMPDMAGGESSWTMFALEFFTVAVLVPVMEEFAFRGVLLSSLREYGAGFAIMGSALVFSLVHMDFSNVVFAFIAGLVFGFLYVKTGNLWITVLIHALNNGIAVAGSYGELLFGEELAGLISDLFLVVPVIVGIIALILLLILKRQKLFGRGRGQTLGIAPLTAGESAAAVARAPLFWVIVAVMLTYTATLFL